MGRKIFWKFNIIDLLLIGILAVSIFALLYKITWGSKADETENYLFTYVCQSTPKETLSGIVQGMACTDGDYATELGALTAMHEDAIDGDAEKCRVTFSSCLKGKKNTHGVTVNEVLYLKGKNFNLVIGDSIFSVYLSDIRPLETAKEK